MPKAAQAEVILHIGVPKTGTTAIQAYLYENRRALAKAGVQYPETYLENFSRFDQWAHHLHAHKWGGWLDQARFKVSPDKAWEYLKASIVAHPGRYIISSERLADLLPLAKGKEVLRYICDMVSPARVRVFGYVRRQDILAESFLKQAVKVKVLKGTQETYLNDLPQFLDFYRLFSNAAECVGWDNVIVRVYERSRLVGRDAVADFLSALKIEQVAEPNKDTISINASINTLTTRVLLSPTIRGGLNDSPNVVSALRDYFSRPEFNALDKFSLFDKDTRKNIMTRYNEGNSLLAEKLGLPDLSDALKLAEGDLAQYIGDVPDLFGIAQVCEVAEIVRDVTRRGITLARAKPAASHPVTDT